MCIFMRVLVWYVRVSDCNRASPRAKLLPVFNFRGLGGAFFIDSFPQYQFSA